MAHHVLREEHLGRALQPIRGLALANAIFAALEVGLLDSLSRSPSLPAELARTLDLHEGRLESLLDYLSNEGVVHVASPEGIVSLTSQGMSFLEVRPWYQLMVGGYADTFSQLRIALKPEASYATRDGAYVATGSCGISQHDALPMVLELLRKMPAPPALVDLGCGDGTFIAEIARALPLTSCFGVEPDSAARDIATQRAHDLGVHNLTILAGDALNLPTELEDLPDSTAFLTAFVLQEILEQSGEDAVVGLLARAFQRRPQSAWLVVEVDRRAALAELKSPLALGYYNPYYLLHGITQQKLIPLKEWSDIYRRAGLRIVAESYPDPRYDSLELKVGHLLRREAGQ